MNSFRKVIAKLSFVVFSICAVVCFESASAYAASEEKVQNIKQISNADDYVLTLQERGNVNEQIKGTDIKLQYSSDAAKTPIFNEGLLKQKIDDLYLNLNYQIFSFFQN